MAQEERVVIVTGAGQGIGKAIAGRFATDGLTVVLAEIDEEAGQEAEVAIGGRARFVRTDVASEESVRQLVDRTVAEFGRLDVLVNNAGLSSPGHTPLAELTLETWNHYLAVNLTGVFLCTKHAASHLRAARGSVVNIASTRALMSEPDTEAYSASKGGVVALTHALAMSLGPEVRVNCISPGWIEVSGWKKNALRQEPRLSEADGLQHPAGRVGRPEDVASLAAWLAAPEATFVTGANFVVDGGMTRKMIYV